MFSRGFKTRKPAVTLLLLIGEYLHNLKKLVILFWRFPMTFLPTSLDGGREEGGCSFLETSQSYIPAAHFK
jgi:hypothetical protein